MPFTTTNYIDQPYASTFVNVNPYNVFEWGGEVELSPDSDEWKEVDVRPNVVIDDSSSYNQFVEMAEETGILGTQWNEWETNWTGTDISIEVDGEEDFFERNFQGRGGRVRGRRRGRIGVTTTTTMTTTENQSRSGIRTNVAFDTVTRSDGQRVVEVNFVPFIRSRKIFFKAQLMKPNTRIYMHFLME